MRRPGVRGKIDINHRARRRTPNRRTRCDVLEFPKECLSHPSCCRLREVTSIFVLMFVMGRARLGAIGAGKRASLTSPWASRTGRTAR